MKYTLFTLFLLSTICLSGQNLVPNANLEDFSSCPLDISDFNALEWYNPSGAGSPDYYHECGGPNVHVPDNVVGFQNSSTGAAYGGVSTFSTMGFFREYMQVALSSATVAGSCYELTIIYSPADEVGWADGLGLLLSNGLPPVLLGQVPQLIKTTVQEDAELWHTLTTQYISPGGETHVTIGNFNDDASTSFLAGGGPIGGFSYYYIDSVAVEYLGNGTTSEVDLGADVEICEQDFPYTISSNLPDATNVWNTGETGPSITVTGPGVYFVEAFYGCLSDTDTIEISVFEEPTLEIEDSTICSGDTYVINLDETLGDYLWEDGTTNSDFTVSETGTYGVTLTHTCGQIVDEFHVDVFSVIDIPPAMDLELCITELPYILDYSQFDDGLNEFLWQDGTDASMHFINTDGVFSLLISNECYSDFIDFQVGISQSLPTFINFTDTIACVDEEVVINLNITDVEYEWQDGTSAPFFFANGPGDYAVTVSNFCGSEMFEFQINEAEEVSLDLGDDVSICPGDSVLISSPNGEVLEWSNGVTASFVWVTEDGSLIALAEGICGNISDTIQIVFDGTVPQIDIPDSLLVCAGDTIFVTASDQLEGVDYIWSTGSVEPIIAIFEAGTYIVSGENNCGMNTDSVVVSIGEFLPDPDLEESYLICPGDSIEISILTNGGIVEWSTGSIDSFIHVKTEGTYFVSLTNSCTTKEDSFILTFKPELSNLDLGEDFGICEGASKLIEVGSFEGEYLWNDGTSEESLLIDQVGIYSLEITGECNMVSDSIEVLDLGTAPIIDLGADIEFCNGDSLTIDVTSATVDEVIWNTGSTESSITIFTAGIYFVEANNLCGSDSDTILVSINDEVPDIYLGIDQEICPGDTILLDIGNVSGNIEWNTGEEGTSIEVYEEGIYFVNLSSSCGSSIDSILIEELEKAPEIDLGDNQVLCFGEALEFDLEVGSETSILWSNGGDSEMNSFTESGLIWVELSNACGMDQDSLILEIVPKVFEIDLGNDLSFCDEDSFQIISGIFQFDVQTEWNTGEMMENIVVMESGEYWVQVSNTCFEERDTISLTFESSPTDFNLGMNDTICMGESIVLVEDQGDNFDYQWQDNSTNKEYVVSESGTYELTISNDCGMFSDQVDILVLSSDEIEVPLEATYVLCEDEPLEIDLSDINTDFISWNDGSNEVIRLITDPGMYFIELANICSNTVVNFLLEHENCSENGAVFIPNIFTPNGDGINDLFKITINENWLSPKIKLAIYNRWGEKVFYSESLNFAWDGTYKGKSLNPGVYAYYIELDVVIDGESKLIQKAGDLTIVK